MPLSVRKPLVEQLRRKKKKKPVDLDVPLQITSMIDMLMIILIFLLKSYSTDTAQLEAPAGIDLPTGQSQSEPTTAVTVVAFAEHIELDGEVIATMKSGKIERKHLSESNRLIGPLFSKLNELATSSKKAVISERKKGSKEALFQGKIVLQADKEMSTRVLKQIMYTAARAGYHDLKFAVIKGDSGVLGPSS